MFKVIDRLSVKVTTFCNMNCSYCHQLSLDKDKPGTFQHYDELKAFLARCNMAPRVKTTITGGEISLRLAEFQRCCEELNSIGNAVYAPNVVTNGSNLKGLLNLVRKGVMRADALTLSWDGLHSCSRTRHGKGNTYSDAYFNNNIRMIGRLGLGHEVNPVYAVTPANVDEMYDSMRFCIDNGVENFTYYLIHEGNYDDEDFLRRFRAQLEKMADEFAACYGTERQFALYNLQNLYSRLRFGGDFLSNITCRKLGRTLHIDTEGDIYGCIYFGDHRALQLGSILDGGMYEDRLEEFSKLFLKKPSCMEGCSLVNCFECPASNYVSLGEMQEKRGHACQVRRIEQEVFDDVLERIHITDAEKNSFWLDYDAESGNHMLVKAYDRQTLGVPLATSERHRKNRTPIDSEHKEEIAAWH